MQRRHPGQYDDTLLRTLQRRVRSWGASHGGENDGMRPSRNNLGVSHENGSIEARQKTLKRTMEQALLLRGHRNFTDLDAYRQFVAEVFGRLNTRVASKFTEERKLLRALPSRRSSDYEEVDARVTKYGTMTVTKVLYAAPSRLVGHRLKVRIFSDKLECWLGDVCVLELNCLPTTICWRPRDGIKRLWGALAAQSNKWGWPAERFLAAVMEHKLAEREARRWERHRHESQLLPGKLLSNFDFTTVPTVSKAHVSALVEGDGWIEQGANLLLFGPPGVGKSHLVCAIGNDLIDRGYRVHFTPTSDLVQRLQVARPEMRLPAEIAKLDGSIC